MPTSTCVNCVLVLNPPTRIYEAIPQGTAALSSVLFFDEINRDSKGFVSADGVIIVGGFFNRYPSFSALFMSYPATFICLKITTHVTCLHLNSFICPKI